MQKHSRAQCLQVVFKWFSQQKCVCVSVCVFVYIKRAYKMLTIGESK